MLSLFADPAQHLQLDISIEGSCPPELEMPALRATHEFVGNAVRHGMYVRLIGRISVSLTCRTEAVELVVIDDGWGPAAAPESEQGFGLIRDLVEQFRGTFSVGRRDDKTVATITLRTTR
jgi:two-component sensor histidine kinase